MIFQKVNEYKEMKPGLERIEKFLLKSGVKYKDLKYVHIAGTNGKGSTAVMLAECLKAAGYKTGLYISPHIVKINERIRIDSADITDPDLKSLDAKYAGLAKKCGLTFFEYVTALAFAYFTEQKVDIAVLETGLGGRFDATNVVTPLVSVITGVGLDHTEILGGSLSKIAFEKAGIIKKNIPVVCGPMPAAAARKISAVAASSRSEMFIFGRDFSASGFAYDWKKLRRKVSYRGLNGGFEFNLNLAGDFQVYNAAAALCVCELLKEKGFKIKPASLKRALGRIKWPARFDVRKVKYGGKKIIFIIDGAHNPEAVSNFLKLYKQSPFSKRKAKLIFAVMREKDYKKIVKETAFAADEVFLAGMDNERAVEADVLEKEFLKYKKAGKVKKYKNVKECLLALKNNDTAVVAGSFYLAGGLLKSIEEEND